MLAASPAPNFEALRMRLMRLRASRQWTYEELAERSGVSRATLIAIETAMPRVRTKGSPASRGSLETWWHIARAFDIRIGDLLQALDEEA